MSAIRAHLASLPDVTPRPEPGSLSPGAAGGEGWGEGEALRSTIRMPCGLRKRRPPAALPRPLHSPARLPGMTDRAGTRRAANRRGGSMDTDGTTPPGVDGLAGAGSGPREAMPRARWFSLMRTWDLPPCEEAWRALVSAYGQKHRHYHTGTHVDACPRRLDACVEALDRPREVELALWFHDAVYDPLSSKNEQKSARWVQDFLARHGAPEEAIARVVELIMVTRHEAPTCTNDQSFLVDIDLSILGARPAVYDFFEQAIRREYRHVPAVLYRAGRARRLEQFLARPRIYANRPFRLRERQARANLARAVAQLRS
ncbi:HD domain-containing protein [Frateuria soli]|uniref:HD domain-containing protein n=1 Tax=Frateuria soli TaxID=1542730 RepID=UPI001E4DF376|nr:hypothetical protein [Frateuria soli]UGB36823.1 hypothetical protein LQ771_08180 [Frateuria soli]